MLIILADIINPGSNRPLASMTVQPQTKPAFTPMVQNFLFPEILL